MPRFALLFLLILLPFGAAHAAEDSIYAVHGVEVDASADTPAAARDKAIAQGARKGLEQLLHTLTDNAKDIPTITDKAAGPLVLDFDVESERSSAKRYIATLGFRYKPDGVKALLAQVKSPHVANRGPLVLIVPVYRAASGDLLWQTENPWRDAWKNAADHAGLVPVVVATGSPEDAKTFTANDLDDNAKLLELAERYKAGSAAVVIASAVSPTGEPGQGLNLTLADGGGPDTSFTSPGASTPAATLQQGVETTLNTLDGLWRQYTLKGTTGAVSFKTDAATATDDGAITPAAALDTAPFTGTVFALRANLTQPGEWAALRMRLGQLSGLSHIELKSLTRDEVIFTLGISGDEDKLAHALADGGIMLGAPQAVPANSNALAMVPNSGPGAGLIYPISQTERIQ